MGYKYASEDGLASSNDPSLITHWNSIGKSLAKHEQVWIADLRRQGVKAAHPDDGWVDREANSVQFAYPQFDDNPSTGDLIALGTPDNYRIVKVVDVTTEGVLMPHSQYYFKESN